MDPGKLQCGHVPADVYRRVSGDAPDDGPHNLVCLESVNAKISRPGMNWLVPSLSDCLFIAIVLWLFFTVTQSSSGLLQDASTGTHIRTGEYIVEHHEIPRTDPFSFTRPGDRWFAWEWLSDVLFAVVHRAFGLRGVVVSAALLIALSLWILLQQMLWRGANVLVAIGLLNVGIAASWIHYIARPHIFTLLFMAGSLWLIDRDRAQPTQMIWALAPLTALWVNLHGGFVALIVSLGAITAGTALERKWAASLRYFLVMLGCAAASFVNPFGYELHICIAICKRFGFVIWWEDFKRRDSIQPQAGTWRFSCFSPSPPRRGWCSGSSLSA